MIEEIFAETAMFQYVAPRFEQRLPEPAHSAMCESVFSWLIGRTARCGW